MSKIRVGHSPLGNKIFAGTIINRGTMWSPSKRDVTIEALVAVCHHVVQFGDHIVPLLIIVPAKILFPSGDCPTLILRISTSSFVC